MSTEYYTVEQIADKLGLHPKTVQRYLREGRLKATKIGKSWLVPEHELSAFTALGSETSRQASDQVSDSGRITMSSVIDMRVRGKSDAETIINTLNAYLNSKPAELGHSSMHAQYIPAQEMVRITLWGTLLFMSEMTVAVSAIADRLFDEEEEQEWISSIETDL